MRILIRIQYITFDADADPEPDPDPDPQYWWWEIGVITY